MKICLRDRYMTLHESQYSTITIDTATLELNPVTFNYELKFSGILEIEAYYGQYGHPLNEIDEETALILARELMTQIKIISALTNNYGG
jgi:hypothetical protein